MHAKWCPLYLLQLPFGLALITSRTLFVLASTTLRPRFDHLRYSLRTAIVLRSLYLALFALRTTVHACSATISRATEQLWPAYKPYVLRATIVQLLVKCIVALHACKHTCECTYVSTYDGQTVICPSYSVPTDSRYLC
jgi:hypothetical protein